MIDDRRDLPAAAAQQARDRARRRTGESTVDYLRRQAERTAARLGQLDDRRARLSRELAALDVREVELTAELDEWQARLDAEES